jgi:endonuclease/exonuclease/phosphatase (EEP) superfamily protein YafD
VFQRVQRTVDATLRATMQMLPARWRIDRGSARVGATAVRPHRGTVALGVAGVLALAGRRVPATAAVAAGLVGTAPAVRRLSRRPPSSPAGGPVVTVLVANVLLGRADRTALAALIAAERPDLAVLPEAGAGYRDALLPLLDDYRGWSSVPPGVPEGRGTVVLAAPRAGDVEVRPGEGMRLPHLEITGGLLGPRTLYAVHTSAPTDPRRLASWRDELALIGSWTRARPAPIVAGDLNAVLDHRRLRAALGGCRDVAEGTGRGAAGTFPSSWPRWAGIRIDHVLVPRRSTTHRYAVRELPGSDHRAVLVRVALPGQASDGY